MTEMRIFLPDCWSNAELLHRKFKGHCGLNCDTIMMLQSKVSVFISTYAYDQSDKHVCRVCLCIMFNRTHVPGNWWVAIFIMITVVKFKTMFILADKWHQLTLFWTLKRSLNYCRHLLVLGSHSTHWTFILLFSSMILRASSKNQNIIVQEKKKKKRITIVYWIHWSSAMRRWNDPPREGKLNVITFKNKICSFFFSLDIDWRRGNVMEIKHLFCVCI